MTSPVAVPSTSAKFSTVMFDSSAETIKVERKPPVQSEMSLWVKSLQESRSVATWMVASTFLRIVVMIMVQLIPYRQDCNKNQCTSEIAASVMTTLSVMFSWILGAICPSKVLQNAAPGFVYASGWILMSVKDFFGSTPSVPLRIAETLLGRLGSKELLVLLPLHFACVISTCIVLQRVLPTSLHALAFEPIEYGNGDTWILDLMRESFVTAIFCVAFLVVPELFRINNLPRWSGVVFLYPIYNLAVDSSGTASAFAPNVLYGLAVMTDSKDEQLIRVLIVRLMGSIIGGLVGGLTMRRFFPDDCAS